MRASVSLLEATYCHYLDQLQLRLVGEWKNPNLLQSRGALKLDNGSKVRISECGGFESQCPQQFFEIGVLLLVTVRQSDWLSTRYSSTIWYLYCIARCWSASLPEVANTCRQTPALNLTSSFKSAQRVATRLRKSSKSFFGGFLFIDEQNSKSRPHESIALRPKMVPLSVPKCFVFIAVVGSVLWSSGNGKRFFDLGRLILLKVTVKLQACHPFHISPQRWLLHF